MRCPTLVQGLNQCKGKNTIDKDDWDTVNINEEAHLASKTLPYNKLIAPSLTIKILR